MHIKFKKIRWKNLLSTGNTWIEFSLDDKPSTLIIGANGSGKSQMLDAISLGLFGKPFRNIRKGQLVNSINKKDCLIEIEFDVGVKDYKVVRGISPNVFEVWSQGIMLNQNRESKDYQAYLEKYILGMNQKTFNQIVIAGAAQYTPFMKLSAADRRAFIEDLLDIQVFSVMSSILKSRVSENKTDIEKIKIKLDGKHDQRKMIEKTILDIEKQNSTKIEQLKKERFITDANIVSSEVTYMYLLAEIKQNELLLADESKIRNKLQKLVGMKIKIETNKENLLQKHDFLDKNTDCPTCKQKIADEFKIDEQCSIDLKIAEIDKGIFEISEEIRQLKTEIDVFDTYNKSLQELKQKKYDLEGSIKSGKALISRIDKEIEAITTGKGILSETQGNLIRITCEIDELAKRQKELVDQKTILTTASELLKDGGIKTKIVKQYVPIINQTVNKYLKSLGFLVQFELDESFNETIKSRYRDEFSYDNFSEGEKMRIDLSLMLTWRSIAKARNSSSANLLILDEVFDGSLDDTGIDDFLKIMQGMSSDTNVFVISHKQEQMIDKFSRVYRVEKKRNYSIVTEL